jgi:hypothetical protein
MCRQEATKNRSGGTSRLRILGIRSRSIPAAGSPSARRPSDAEPIEALREFDGERGALARTLGPWELIVHTSTSARLGQHLNRRRLDEPHRHFHKQVLDVRVGHGVRYRPAWCSA